MASSLNVKSLDELAALSKAKTGTLSYIVPSVPLALYMDKWKQESGADLVRVPFRGARADEPGSGRVSGARTSYFGIVAPAGTPKPTSASCATRWRASAASRNSARSG